jgi:hypothetical protein
MRPASVPRGSRAATEGFDLVAKELVQRNPKRRDFDTKSVVVLRLLESSSKAAF